MNSLNEVMVVGLTGQTGAGKSTVSKVFAENGFSVINADKIARLVVEKGSKCLAELEESFGDGIINENDELNRKALASIVFSDSKKLELLNTITRLIVFQLRESCSYYLMHQLCLKAVQMISASLLFP